MRANRSRVAPWRPLRSGPWREGKGADKEQREKGSTMGAEGPVRGHRLQGGKGAMGLSVTLHVRDPERETLHLGVRRVLSEDSGQERVHFSLHLAVAPGMPRGGDLIGCADASPSLEGAAPSRSLARSLAGLAPELSACPASSAQLSLGRPVLASRVASCRLDCSSVIEPLPSMSEALGSKNKKRYYIQSLEGLNEIFLL